MTAAPPARPATADWAFPPAADTAAFDGRAGALDGSIPPLPLAQLLARRGLDTPRKVRQFIEPPHPLPHDPLLLDGMRPALERIHQAIARRERIGVFGDFDVDGVTATAILCDGLAAMGAAAPVIPYLPHRIYDGHGLTTTAIDRLSRQGVTLIITVDCGIADVEQVAYAAARRIDVIITDHHTPQTAQPQAAAIINPKLDGSRYPFTELCGAGLAFKLIQGLYESAGAPWDAGLLELAALGTVADLVPLLDENRYLVAEGLKQLAQTRRPGLRALLQTARQPAGEIDAQAIAFRIAPRLNSAGRMGHPLDSLRLLTAQSEAEAQSLAEGLEALNEQRRQATAAAEELAESRLRQLRELPPLLLVADAAIPRGVAGLVAGRLAEQRRRPAVVLAVEGDYAVASARSIPGFNILEAIQSAGDLLVRYGGHRQAAGFTVASANLPELQQRLEAYAAEHIERLAQRPAVSIDAIARLPQLTPDLMDWLAQLEPFGAGHPRPLFAALDVAVTDYRYMGAAQQHLKLRVEQDSAALNALAFNMAGEWRPDLRRLDLAFTPFIDTWRGVSELALRVSHLRPAV